MNARRQELYGLLGRLPGRHVPIDVRCISRETRDGYRLETLLLTWQTELCDPVPAYFVCPVDGDGPWPTILYSHAHGNAWEIGKDELLTGRAALQRPAYAESLTARGWAAMCIDHWCFGERRGRTEGETFRRMLWNGQILWGMMLYDSLRALDYLHTRPDVDARRIGALGISMGSMLSWWLAALDPRIAAVAEICCLGDFEALAEAGCLEMHGLYYFVPDLQTHFTAGQIAGLIAPRPHLALAGRHDKLTPLSGLRRIDRHLRDVYAAHDQPDAWRLHVLGTGHQETAEMRRIVVEFFDQWL